MIQVLYAYKKKYLLLSATSSFLYIQYVHKIDDYL